MGSKVSKENEFGFNEKTTSKEVLGVKNLKNKHFFVTGGSSGIGLEVCKNLFNANAIVTIASNYGNEEAKKFILKQKSPSCSGKIFILDLDLSDQSSIKESVDKYKSRKDYKKIQVLICNAGVMMAKLQTTHDGFELHAAINHFGHFTLCMLLLPLIETPGRIVILSSKGHKEFGATINFDDMEFKKAKAIVPGKRIIRAQAYGQSKLAQLLFSRELNKRLKEAKKDIISISLHPGVVKTNLSKSDFWTNLYYEIGNLCLNYFKSLECAAATTIFCAVDERIPKYSGKYFQDCGISTNISKIALNDEVAKRLFDLSEKRTGIKFPFTNDINKV